MSQQPAQMAHPTLINLPPPPSHPDTPSEAPGTPTSTTTSLSALSTTAIKDGHRGAPHHRGHHHGPAANSLEAERADRISRLTGLSSLSVLHSTPPGLSHHNAHSQQTTPTSSGFPAMPMGISATPAYFDAAGQPVAITKASTVGSASATESVGGKTSASTEVGGDNCTLADDRDEDMFTEMDSASASGYMGPDAMDEDLDNLASRSVGAYEDRMSDDGNASLVGFGEGAGSTLSGPIYQRRPPGTQGGTAAAGGTGPFVWPPERSSSGLSEGAPASSPSPYHAGAAARRDFAAVPARPSDRDRDRDTGSDTPASQAAVRERREARMVDGVALDRGASTATPSTTTTMTAPAAGAAATPAAVADDDVFVDTTTCGPVPAQPAATTTTTTPGNTTRERLQQQQQSSPSGHRQQHHTPRHQAARTPRHQQHTASSPPGSSPLSSARDAAERILRERLDEGESRIRDAALVGKGEDRLGRFYFEDS